MAYKVIVKKQFSVKLAKVLLYLENEWSAKVAQDFLSKVDRRVKLLEIQPYIGRLSSKMNTARGLLITRHNKLYYKIEDTTVVIVDMFDTRMNPKKNPY